MTMILLVMCGAIVVTLALIIGVVTFMKLGVIFRHAAQPPHQDGGNYTLDQGREVRPEQDG